MGRRRRTKVRTRPRAKLPNIFDCPLCSKKAVSITFEKDQNVFELVCKNCGKKYRYSNPTRIPIKFGCPNCRKNSVTIEFVETTNSIQIICSECNKSTFASAKRWEQDPEAHSVLPFTEKGAKLGCPNCGFRTLKMNVKLRKEFAVIQCGACGVKDMYPITFLDEKVDVYGKFVDVIRSDMKAIEKLGPDEALKVEERAKRYKEILGTSKISSTPSSEAQSSEIPIETEELFEKEDSSE